MSFLSNVKCNAAGLAPEHSMVLPEREARADEQPVLAALGSVRGPMCANRTH